MRFTYRPLLNSTLAVFALMAPAPFFDRAHATPTCKASLSPQELDREIQALALRMVKAAELTDLKFKAATQNKLSFQLLAFKSTYGEEAFRRLEKATADLQARTRRKNLETEKANEVTRQAQEDVINHWRRVRETGLPIEGSAGDKLTFLSDGRLVIAVKDRIDILAPDLKTLLHSIAAPGLPAGTQFKVSSDEKAVLATWFISGGMTNLGRDFHLHANLSAKSATIDQFQITGLQPKFFFAESSELLIAAISGQVKKVKATEMQKALDSSGQVPTSGVIFDLKVSSDGRFALIKETNFNDFGYIDFESGRYNRLKDAQGNQIRTAKAIFDPTPEGQAEGRIIFIPHDPERLQLEPSKVQSLVLRTGQVRGLDIPGEWDSMLVANEQKTLVILRKASALSRRPTAGSVGVYNFGTKKFEEIPETRFFTSFGPEQPSYSKWVILRGPETKPETKPEAEKMVHFLNIETGELHPVSLQHEGSVTIYHVVNPHTGTIFFRTVNSKRKYLEIY